MSTSDVVWEQLNPARGDKSPMAATLWGDRTGPGPSGFLLRPVDGFKSPPHVHTAHYHGVVIRGAVHNAAPDAEEDYLPPGSFWTQPGGGVHVTAARGDSLAYIEVEGAFDVLPADRATNGDERAVVMRASSIAWVDVPGAPASGDGPKVAALWGERHDAEPRGTLVKVPAGLSATIRSRGAMFRAVVIRGSVRHRSSSRTADTLAEPGSYVSSKGEFAHQVSCDAGEDCIVYVRSTGAFDVTPGQPVR